MRTPQARPLRMETLESRLLLDASPHQQFLLDAANQYAFRSSGDDAGSPIIPLYTDHRAGGTYGAVDDSVRLTLDGNDAGAARGTSSFRLSWDLARDPGPNAYFQFGVGCGQTNRPRDLPGWLATAVRFEAKGDVAGRQMTVNVFRRGAGCLPAQIATGSFSLTAGWSDYRLDIPDLPPHELHAVQFVLASGDPTGGATRTVWLDDVRLDANFPDPLRAVQSFQALASAADNPCDNAACPIDTPPERDRCIYPNRSFLYDNALAIKILAASGDPALVQVAREVADGIIATVLPDGSYYNVRPSGHSLLGNGAPRDPWSQLRTLGDNAWFGLALLSLYRLTRDSDYLARAQAISDWAESQLKETSSPWKGYRGGYGEDGTALAYRATEHNLDLFQLNWQLAAALKDLGGPSAGSYLDRARHAGDFVIHMFDEPAGADPATKSWFWTGTLAGDAVNTDSIPLDAQIWAFLTLGQSTEYREALDWSRPLHWVKANLLRAQGELAGYTFSSRSTPEGIWFEGTAAAAVAFELAGDIAHAAVLKASLDWARTSGPNASPDGRGLIAASIDGLQDPYLGAVYDARRHVAATAWAEAASRGFNLFGSDQPSVTLYDQNGEVLVVHCGAIAGAPDVPILLDGVPAAIGDQIVISRALEPGSMDYRQVLVLDSRGFLRLRHLDSDMPPGSEDAFGASFKLPPGLILLQEDGSEDFYLSSDVSRIQVATGGPQGLALSLTGCPFNGQDRLDAVQVEWQIGPLITSANTTTMPLATTVTTTQDLQLSPNRLQRAEAFQVAMFSSSNLVPCGGSTHDSDQLLVTNRHGRQLANLDLLDAAVAPCGTRLLLPDSVSQSGLPFDGILRLNQRYASGLNGDPPNLQVQVAASDSGPVFRAQGYITPSEDPNDDNLGVWVHRDFAAPQIPAGSGFAWSLQLMAFDEPLPWQNPLVPLDVNSSGSVSPIDALLIINDLNRFGPRFLPLPEAKLNSPTYYLDTTGDDRLSPRDAILIINFLNRQSSGQGAEGEPSAAGEAGGFGPCFLGAEGFARRAAPRASTADNDAGPCPAPATLQPPAAGLSSARATRVGTAWQGRGHGCPSRRLPPRSSEIEAAIEEFAAAIHGVWRAAGA